MGGGRVEGEEFELGEEEAALAPGHGGAELVAALAVGEGGEGGVEEAREGEGEGGRHVGGEQRLRDVRVAGEEVRAVQPLLLGVAVVVQADGGVGGRGSRPFVGAGMGMGGGGGGRLRRSPLLLPPRLAGSTAAARCGSGRGGHHG